MGLNLRYSPLEWKNGKFDFGGYPISGLNAQPFGDVYYVDYRNGTSTGPGTTADKAFKLLSQAYAAATSDNNDVIYIDGDSAVVETDMITWAKGRIHVVGVDGAGHLGTGHGARITFAANDTPVAASLCPVTVTGWRNTFSGVKFESSCTRAESLYGHIDAGAYTTYNRCSFLKLNDLDEAGAADVVAQGNGTSWIDCEFGAATVLSSVARHNMLIDKIVSGNGHMDNNFKDCNFIAYTSDADRHFIHVAGTGDAQRYSMFRGTAFINWSLEASGVVMTDAIHSPASTAFYMVFDSGTIVVGCTNIAQSTDNAGVMVSGAVSTAATSCIAVNAA